MPMSEAPVGTFGLIHSGGRSNLKSNRKKAVVYRSFYLGIV
jgi:hypothetical protein